MSCQNAEDVCQHCQEKVQTKTEDSSEEEEEEKETTKYFPKNTMFPNFHQPNQMQKRLNILGNSAFLAATGYVAFYTGKFFLKTFDFGLLLVKDILKSLLHDTPTE